MAGCRPAVDTDAPRAVRACMSEPAPGWGGELRHPSPTAGRCRRAAIPRGRFIPEWISGTQY